MHRGSPFRAGARFLRGTQIARRHKDVIGINETTLKFAGNSVSAAERCRQQGNYLVDIPKTQVSKTGLGADLCLLNASRRQIQATALDGKVESMRTGSSSKPFVIDSEKEFVKGGGKAVLNGAEPIPEHARGQSTRPARVSCTSSSAATASRSVPYDISIIGRLMR